MIVDIFIPAIVVLMMVIVGTGLQAREFRVILQSPGPLIGSTFAQILLLPLGAVIMIALLDPPQELAVGVLLVSACPGGALSNFYCYLGRLNVPLSVMLTAVSSLLSFAALPLVLELTLPAVSSNSDLAIPVPQLMRTLLLFLLLPLGVGMVMRHYFRGLVESYSLRMRALSLSLLVILLLLIVVDQWDTVQDIYMQAALLTLLFSGFAILVAWGTGAVFGLDVIDRYVLSVEFSIRNVGAAALVAVLTLGRPEFLAFGALFVVFQAPLIALLLYRYNARQLKA